MGCGSSTQNNKKAIVIQPVPVSQASEINLQRSPNNANRYSQKENQPIGTGPLQKSSTKQIAKTVKGNNENIPLMQRESETQASNPNLRNFVEVSHFGDLLNDEGEDEITFANGELSPIKSAENNTGRLTRKQRSELINLRTFEHEIASRYEALPVTNKKVQVVRVRRQKNTLFNWPEHGQIEVKTISYKIVYSHAIKGFRTVKSKDQYITSLLSWYKDEEEDIFEFSLKDYLATNLRTGNNIEISTPEIFFQVDTDGKFLGIKDIDRFIHRLTSIQDVGYFTNQKRNELKKKVAYETERFLFFMIGIETYISLN